MATGDTAPPLALSSSPPPLLDHSPSNLSSPLSDVEDKDGNHEEMDVDVHMNDLHNNGTPKRNKNGDAEESDRDSESDDDSKLSEVDVNDSEAETERLYESPRKGDDALDILNTSSGTVTRQFVDRRDRVFERSPSKLQQQIQADLDAENAASNDNSLSDADEEDDDDASVASSEPEPDAELTTRKQPGSRPGQDKKAQAVVPSADSTQPKLSRQDSTESRKRKRPSVAEQSESEQPLSKRTGSIEVPQGDHSGDDFAVIDEEGTSTNPQSGIHSAEEDHMDEDAEVLNEEGKPTDKPEQDTLEPVRAEKGRRGANKKQKPKSPQDSNGDTKEEVQEDAHDDVESAAAEEPAAHAEEDQMEDADEADIAHKNEEERKL